MVKTGVIVSSIAFHRPSYHENWTILLRVTTSNVAWGRYFEIRQTFLILEQKTWRHYNYFLSCLWWYKQVQLFLCFSNQFSHQFPTTCCLQKYHFSFCLVKRLPHHLNCSDDSFGCWIVFVSIKFFRCFLPKLFAVIAIDICF